METDGVPGGFPRSLAWLLLGSLAAMASPGLLAASLTATACVVADSPLNDYTCDFQGPAGSGTLTATTSDTQSYANGNIGFGWFYGTVSSAIFTSNPAGAYGLASVDVEWRDTFNISAGALNGTLGTATFSINVALGSTVAENEFGTIDPNFCTWNCVTASTNWSLDVTAGAYTATQPIKAGGHATDGGFSGDSPGLFTYTVPIVFGGDNDIWVRFIATAGATGAFQPGPATISGSALLDFANTVEWQGITEVRDGDGNLVTAFSVTSGSGVDYAQPIAAVPLPAAGWLLLSAMIALGGRVRRAPG